MRGKKNLNNILQISFTIFFLILFMKQDKYNQKIISILKLQTGVLELQQEVMEIQNIPVSTIIEN